MTLNLIDPKMIVKNTIELQPQKTYVSASIECSDLESLEIEESGVYGQLSSKINNPKKSYSLNINSNSYEFEKFNSHINSNFDKDSGGTVLEKLNRTKENEQNAVEGDFLNANGFSLDNSGEFKFGVEKVKQKFVVDDENFYKKKSIKNLYKFYRENMKYKVLNPHWGFSNYNCLNFFNINNSKNTNKTHKNIIVYPNAFHNSKSIYDFFENNNNNLTLSFYINQNNKNIEGHSFNPGCVLNIPGIIGLYLVKGSNTDQSGYTDKFRLFATLGDEHILSDESVFFLNDNISSSNIENGTSLFLSSDNIINYNHWQNVCVSLEDINDNTLNLKIYIDGNQIDSVTVNISGFRKVNNSNSFICIGNSFKDVSDEIETFKKLFSVNSSSDGDYIGPYALKNINFGENIEDDFFETGTTSIDVEINNSLNVLSGDYITSDTSIALSAEICDVRVYNSSINDIKNLICENSISDFSDNRLIFSLPVLYFNKDIKKKSIVNLNGISDNTSSGSISNINLQNNVFSGPINNYFSNKCLGHEVIVEKFLFEFKQKSCPNVVFNGEYTSDQVNYNLFNVLSYIPSGNILGNSQSNLVDNIKKGENINKLYHQKLHELSLEDNGDFDLYFEKYFTYKNNFIMPCDNGLQTQKYKNYYNNSDEESHYDDNNYFDIGHVSLNKVIKEDSILKSNNLITYIADSNLYDYSYSLKSLMPLEQRETYKISDGVTFKINYDGLKNISLNNFFREDFTLSDNNQTNFLKIKSDINDNKKFVEVGTDYFLKDLSNPVSRKINDSFVNSNASYLPYVVKKELDNIDDNANFIPYFKQEYPLYNLYDDMSETYSKAFCISTQIFGRRLEKESVELYDSGLSGTFGNKKIKLKDNGKGTLYRADSLTKHAEWSYVGHCLYNEGIITILHPSLENFGEFSLKLDFKSSSKLNVYELNLPAYSGRTNKSYNTSQIENLRLNESAFNSDEDFVYITDINLHDSNLNIVAKAKVVKPYAKKDSDNVLFRLKMDY